MVYYGSRPRLDKIRGMLGQASTSSTEPDLAGVQGVRTTVADLLLNRGLDPVVIDMSSILREAGLPMVNLVRVICAELTWPNTAAYPALGHRRYYDLPLATGRASRRLRFEDLNRLAFPYP